MFLQSTLGKKTHNFTLIEIFLVIAILALVGGLIMVRTQSLINHHRYEHSVGRIKEEISFTRRLARNANADIEFHLTQTQKGLIGIRKTDEPLNFPRAIETPISFSHLHMKENSPLTITFTGSGWVKESVTLTVCLNDKSETLTFSNTP